MPTYEYACPHCGHKFELFQKITDQPLEHCPKCAKKVKRLIGSGSGIIFKGSGFYATDYKRKGVSADKAAGCPHAKPECHACPAKKK